MFINSNLDSIQKTSQKHSLLKPYCLKFYWNKEAINFDFNIKNDEFKIIYRSSYSQDGEEYSQSDVYESYEIDYKKLNSLIRFHVGLMLPKTKSSIVKKVASEVLAKMKHEHDHYQPGFYGESESFSRYVIKVSHFVNIVVNSSYIQENLKKTEAFIASCR
jgi:hypothetical protein